MTETIEQLVAGTIESYYDYAVKVEAGCAVIVESFKQNNLQAGLQGIVDLSEGLAWLIEAENLLEGQSYKIVSPITSVSPLFGKINEAIGANDFEQVVSLIEEELQPLFKNASDWKFEEVIS